MHVHAASFHSSYWRACVQITWCVVLEWASGILKGALIGRGRHDVRGLRIRIERLLAVAMRSR